MDLYMMFTGVRVVKALGLRLCAAVTPACPSEGILGLVLFPGESRQELFGSAEESVDTTPPLSLSLSLSLSLKGLVVRF